MLLTIKKEYIDNFYVVDKNIPEKIHKGKVYNVESYFYLDKTKQHIFLKISNKKQKLKVLLDGKNLHTRNYIDVLYNGILLTVDEMFFIKI